MIGARQRLIFNASFPRSGGTLLQLILSQNPDIFASVNSPLLELVHSLTVLFEGSFSRSGPDDLAAKAYSSSIRALIGGFYSFAAQPLVIDKAGTGALHYAQLLRDSLDEFKTIVCVRDPRSIIAVLERDCRQGRLAAHELPPALLTRSLAERVEWWLTKGQLGQALARWQYLFSSGRSEDYFVLRYEDLCQVPLATLGLLHDFLAIPQFKYRPEELSSPSPLYCFHQSSQHYGGALHEARSEHLEYLGTEISNQIVLSNAPFYLEIYPDIFAMDPSLISAVLPEQK